MKSWAESILLVIGVYYAFDFGRKILMLLAEIVTEVGSLREEMGRLHVDMLKSTDEIRSACDSAARAAKWS